MANDGNATVSESIITTGSDLPALHSFRPQTVLSRQTNKKIPTPGTPVKVSPLLMAFPMESDLHG